MLKKTLPLAQIALANKDTAGLKKKSCLLVWDKNIFLVVNTVWHNIFAGGYFCGLVIFCVLQELICLIRPDKFFLLGIVFF